MSNYSEFFLNSSSRVVELELIQLSHPNFSKVYYLVRNAINGVTVTHEDTTVHTYEYYPMQLTYKGDRDDLDQGVDLGFGDVGEVLALELDAVYAADGFEVKPVAKVRTYRSDDLTAPLAGPFSYQVDNIAFAKEGATLEAGAQRLNQTSTGENFNVDRFKSLRGFL